MDSGRKVETVGVIASLIVLMLATVVKMLV